MKTKNRRLFIEALIIFILCLLAAAACAGTLFYVSHVFDDFYQHASGDLGNLDPDFPGSGAYLLIAGGAYFLGGLGIFALELVLAVGLVFSVLPALFSLAAVICSHLGKVRAAAGFLYTDAAYFLVCGLALLGEGLHYSGSSSLAVLGAGLLLAGLAVIIFLWTLYAVKSTPAPEENEVSHEDQPN